MREHVEALRALFTMEEVTYEGEIVQLDRVRLDVAYGDTSQEIFRSTSAQPVQKCLNSQGDLRRRCP